MAEEARPKRKGNVIVWAILGLLVLSLGGFGIGSFGGSLSAVATVGDREVTVQEYADALRAEQRRLQQQLGQPLTVAQMQQFGLDRMVMERLLAAEALAFEAARMDLRAPDVVVADRIRATPAFAGVDGAFDREGYAEALRFAGLNERAFEAQVRDDAAREVLEVAVAGGAAVPDAYADTITTWLAETRDVTVATVGADALPSGPAAPSAEELSAFYDENADMFRLPERRRITVAAITPDALAADLAPDEVTLRAEYDARIDAYRQPARVLAERLAFPDAGAAAAAVAAIEAGETSFDALVAERGLTLDDVDQGELTAEDLPADVAAALFALEEPGLVGPVETTLGPALFRVNAVLDATETPFEAVRGDLSAELSREAARRRIDTAREEIDDLLAGGATLEEIADETILRLDTLAYDPNRRDGIAAEPAFRDLAGAVEEGDFPELGDLSDGGLFALRLDEVVPAEVPPLEDIRPAVEARFRAERDAERLLAEAETLAQRVAAGEAFDAVGLSAVETATLERDGALPGMPEQLVQRLFEAEAGDVIALADDDTRALVARVDGVDRPDPSEGAAAELRAAIVAQARRDIAGDLFDAYGRVVRGQAGFTVNQQAVQSVQAQLLGG